MNLPEIVEQYVKHSSINLFNKNNLIEQIEKIANFKYSKSYIKVYLKKCTVNEKTRTLLGSSGNLFVNLGNNQLEIYDTEKHDVPIYIFDKEASKQNALENKARRDIEVANFMKVFGELYTPFEIKPTNNKILVISQCTARKNVGPLPARKLYAGQQACHLNELITNNKNIDYYILSAGYGLIECNTIINNYDNTFDQLHRADLLRLSKKYKFRESIDELVATNKYELIFILLGDSYLSMLGLNKPFEYNNCKVIAMFLKKLKACKNRPKGSSIIEILFDMKFIEMFKVTALAAKGKIINEFFETYSITEILENPWLLNQFINQKEKLKLLADQKLFI